MAPIPKINQLVGNIQWEDAHLVMILLAKSSTAGLPLFS